MDAHKQVEGRETQILHALGIGWAPHSKHVRCPFPNHPDEHPSWRWDAEKRRYYCTCSAGSIFDAIMRVKGCTFAEAVEFARNVNQPIQLKAFTGKPKAPPEKKKAVSVQHTVALRMPDLKQLQHAKWDMPSALWCYHNAAREIVEVRARYDFTDENGAADKVVLPWIWNGKRWINKAAPEPRPLYGLPSLLVTDENGGPDEPILFVEGEKTAEAAADLFPEYVVTTSSGGSKAAAGTDYTPLHGRHVTIWPDNDEAGVKYAAAIVNHAVEAGAASVRIVDVPQDWPEGWDLADEVPDGANLQEMLFDEALPYPPPPDNVVRPDFRGKKRKGKQAALQARDNTVYSEPINDGFKRNAWTEELLKNVDNVVIALGKLGVAVKYNEFAHEYLIEGLTAYGPALNDDSLDELYLQVWKQYELKYTKADFVMIVLAEARRHRSHPVRTYLNSLEWDGVERIDEWLMTYLGAEDTAVNRAVGRVILLAAVRRVRQPGCKFDPMLVLEGPQYAGKSLAIATLCPDPEWFTDNLGLHVTQKEIIELTSGKWLVEIGELAGMKRSDVEHVKALVSRQVDEARLAYGRMKTRRPRQCVFIGTTNETNYLIDDTGNRRFLPVKVGGIDIPALLRDRDQLWAEAAHFEALGETLELPADVRDELRRVQALREIQDEWEGIIKPWLDDKFPLHGDSAAQRVTLAEVGERALNVDKSRFDHITQKRIARAMKRIGWVKAERGGGKNWWRRAENGENGPI